MMLFTNIHVTSTIDYTYSKVNFTLLFAVELLWIYFIIQPCHHKQFLISIYIMSRHVCICAGVDPIQEAILEYNRARQGVALPPDIYLGLRFNDAEGQPTSDVTGARQVEKLSRIKI